MALIYRSLLEIDDEQFRSAAPDLFAGWLERKVRTNDIDPTHGEIELGGVRYEFSAVEDENSQTSTYRARLFEQRDDEQVRLTFTAIAGDGEAWAWTDVERWTESAYEPGWVPHAPVLVTSLLSRFGARLGPSRLKAEHDSCEREQVTALVQSLLSADRVAPIVAASPTRAERDGDMTPCSSRAVELQRHLAGVASVVMLRPGATSALSAALLSSLGPDWDVHSGAVRTYLPGLRPGDSPRRHRFVPFHRLQGRDPGLAGRLVSLPLHQAATFRAPPLVWQDSARHLPAFAGTTHDDIAEALLADVERERDEARTESATALQRLQEAQETTAEVLTQLDALTRRIAYLESKLAEFDASALRAQPQEQVFEAEWCEDVARKAHEALVDVIIGEGVIEAAGALDVHADNASWARKSWRALQALQSYAEAKRTGDAIGWDFKRFCEHSGHATVIPTTWVSLHEGETTADNRRFRELRTLQLDDQVEASGAIYMPAHIRIEKGGTPCPRIHFHDDTDGVTGKIHIGWFGDHLDSGSKS